MSKQKLSLCIYRGICRMFGPFQRQNKVILCIYPTVAGKSPQTSSSHRVFTFDYYNSVYVILYYVQVNAVKPFLPFVVES